MKAKVLKSERDYQTALTYVERLMAHPAPDTDELDLWSLLVEKYEEARFPIAIPDPIEAIRFRMDQAGLESADLHPYLQSKSKVSEVMNRKRPLSLRMIRALYRGLKIPAEVLMQAPPPLTPPAPALLPQKTEDARLNRPARHSTPSTRCSYLPQNE